MGTEFKKQTTAWKLDGRKVPANTAGAETGRAAAPARRR